MCKPKTPDMPKMPKIKKVRQMKAPKMPTPLGFSKDGLSFTEQPNARSTLTAPGADRAKAPKAILGGSNRGSAVILGA